MDRPPDLRVLVVDGNAKLAGVLTELLDDQPGFRVVGTAVDSATALRAVASTGVDVLLVDERLDGTLAPEALQALRAAAPDAALLLWSHHEVHTAVQGADAVLQRGMTFRELVSVLRAQARRRHDAGSRKG